MEQQVIFKKPKMKEVHVDGGAFTGPPDYKFHNAYFSVVDSNNNLIHFAKDIGDVWSGLAEYEAIKWAIENIPERPLTIFSDCTVAIAWARKGSRKSSKFRVSPLNLKDINLEYKHDNLADRWNAINHSPKKSKSYYYKQWIIKTI